MKALSIFFFVSLLFSCSPANEENEQEKSESKSKSEIQNTESDVYIYILGTIQDAGSPQIGCTGDCCKDLHDKPDPMRKIVSLGVIDQKARKKLIIDASPDFVEQFENLQQKAGFEKGKLDAIFLTHAHIGHYTGLMFLGKESMNSGSVPVYTMPKMKKFLEENGPWSQLVSTKNIKLESLNDQKTIGITENLSITPFLVPHRDEYSETVGFHIQGPNKSALFIPDINKWDVWEKDIAEEIKKVDYAIIDGSFYNGNELKNRDISEIPHPFIVESLEKFKSLSKEEKSKIHFIHFNHTNPLIKADGEAALRVKGQGYRIAEKNMILNL